MEFIISLVLVITGVGAFWGLIWFIGEIFKSEYPNPKQTPVNSDPNWEDHIRHDPYHPAGYPDEDDDYEEYWHR